jgi:hypothetical protein
MTDTSELVDMLEDIKERSEAKQQRREDIAEIKRLICLLAVSNGVSAPSQNGDAPSTWEVMYDG